MEELIEKKIASLEKMIKRLATDEQDPPVRFFFSELSKITKENYFKNIIHNIVERRLRITNEHLAYLLYIALQYLTDFSYDTIPSDIEVYGRQLKNDLIKYSSEIEKTCQTKYASTNVIERYAALQIILAMLNKNNLVVVDIGTGIGLGLMALNTNSFDKIRIENKKLSEYLKKKIDVSKAIGIDPQEVDMKWQKGCYLPEHKENREKLVKKYEELKENGQPIVFIKGDGTNLKNIEELKPNSVDVVWTSNILYQIEGDAKKLENGIKWLLKKDGFWINTDYRHEYQKFATPQNPYVATVRVKPEWKLLEVLESPSDVVKNIKLGKDFNKFVDIVAIY